MQWQPIETAPKSQVVLVFYKTALGKGRIVKARYIEKYTEIEDEDYFEGFHEYSEEKDEYFYPEGWVEMVDNWEEFSSVPMHDQKPTHWMPLPEAPDAFGTK